MSTVQISAADGLLYTLNRIWMKPSKFSGNHIRCISRRKVREAFTKKANEVICIDKPKGRHAMGWEITWLEDGAAKVGCQLFLAKEVAKIRKWAGVK